VLAAIVDIPANVGYSVVFALIAVETMGIPVPGETALIAAALLAHDGEMDIVPLIALAAAAAIIGDNVGFAIGRKAGRRVFVMPGPFHHHRLAALDVGEPFFQRHGPKAVFLGRWVAGLRIASAWLAGMNRMDWPRFLFWNALGGICWATSIALGVYFVGHAFEEVLGVGGIVAAGVVSGGLVGLFVWRRIRARRSSESHVPEPEREPEHAQRGQ
jgi:membrane protein DedA with SNARE-associated domain